ncbi:unnamed protein product [Protopolystoma xenopodis]|uniref:Uncharacterized protein n=1 Tax=Protopolystoma xenopodis TaxID=117903 RepID=A0A448X203_9PLAT|nr:unnamed protein product [Protopolystoma xenopodis]
MMTPVTSKGERSLQNDGCFDAPSEATQYRQAACDYLVALLRILPSLLEARDQQMLNEEIMEFASSYCSGWQITFGRPFSSLFWVRGRG